MRLRLPGGIARVDGTAQSSFEIVNSATGDALPVAEFSEAAMDGQVGEIRDG
jgi:hypothetical protein